MARKKIHFFEIKTGLERDLGEYLVVIWEYRFIIAISLPQFDGNLQPGENFSEAA